jgi:hypothetical protein
MGLRAAIPGAHKDSYITTLTGRAFIRYIGRFPAIFNPAGGFSIDPAADYYPEKSGCGYLIDILQSIIL